MKSLRLSLVSIVAMALATASFAGPGLRYSKSRSAVPTAPAEKAVVKEDTKGTCKSMTATHGRFSRVVKCDPEKVAGCKTHCEK